MSGGETFGRGFNIDAAIVLTQGDVDAAYRTIGRYDGHDLDAMLGFAPYEGGNTRARTGGLTKPVTRKPQYIPSGDAA